MLAVDRGFVIRIANEGLRLPSYKRRRGFHFIEEGKASILQKKVKLTCKYPNQTQKGTNEYDDGHSH